MHIFPCVVTLKMLQVHKKYHTARNPGSSQFLVFTHKAVSATVKAYLLMSALPELFSVGLPPLCYEESGRCSAIQQKRTGQG